MYNPIDNHFATLIEDDLYDCTGKISLSEEWIGWDNYITYHQIEARRIYRDCIFQVPEEEWNSSKFIAKYPWDFIP